MGIDLAKLDAVKIETTLFNLIRPMFDEDDVFVMGGSRNATINHDKQIYCNAPIDIQDLNAYGKTVCRIEIFVKKISGIKDAENSTRIRDLVVSPFKNGIKLGDYHFEYVKEFNGDDRAQYGYIFINLATLIL